LNITQKADNHGTFHIYQQFMTNIHETESFLQIDSFELSLMVYRQCVSPKEPAGAPTDWTWKTTCYFTV